MRFVVGGNGWSTQKRFYSPGTVVDDGFNWESRASVIPMDATPLTQVTYDYMTSNGFTGLGYPYWAVRAGPGVVPIHPPYGALIVLGSDRRLGSGYVLG